LGNARAEDDADVLSASTRRLVRGGPSFSDADVFRGEEEEAEGEEPRAQQTPEEGAATGSLPPEQASPPSPGDIACIEESTSMMGELPQFSPPRPPPDRLSQSERSPHAVRKRASTVGIMKPSAIAGDGAISPEARKARYQRSVSWGHLVFSKEEVRDALRARRGDAAPAVLSYPHLSRGPASRAAFLPPLTLGPPLRSDSAVSLASLLSPGGTPGLARAHPVFSPQPGFGREPAAAAAARPPRRASWRIAAACGLGGGGGASAS
jgi:hypothetical protein